MPKAYSEDLLWRAVALRRATNASAARRALLTPARRAPGQLLLRPPPGGGGSSRHALEPRCFPVRRWNTLPQSMHFISPMPVRNMPSGTARGSFNGGASSAASSTSYARARKSAQGRCAHARAPRRTAVSAVRLPPAVAPRSSALRDGSGASAANRLSKSSPVALGGGSPGPARRGRSEGAAPSMAAAAAAQREAPRCRRAVVRRLRP